MTKIAINDTYQGMTNQAPWRKQPGAVTDIQNLTLDIVKGAITRNGTDRIRWLVEIPVELDPEDVLFFPFLNDIVCVYDEGLLVFDGATGVKKIVKDTTHGFGYLSGITKATTRWAAFRNSVMICNTETATAAENTPDYTVSATVDRYSDLPATAIEGQYYRCTFNDGAVSAGYYKRVLISGSLDWQRVAAPNQPNGRFDASTMPHQLLRLDDGTYEWGELEYSDRESGNDDTNPLPSWIGQPITEIDFHAQGRFFLFSQGKITASSSKDKFSFWIDDIDNASDVTNPIDHDISKAGVGSPLFVRTIGNDLWIACERGQIIFTSGQEQLTNVNGSDAPLSELKTSNIHPASNGSSIVMLDQYNILHEFVMTPQGYVSQGSDLQSHALNIFEGYTPNQIFRFGGTTFITTNEGTVFVHELRIDSGELVQTGWTKFEFNYPGGTNNLPYFFDEQNGEMRIICRNEDNGFVLLRYYHAVEPLVDGYLIAPRLDLRDYVEGTYFQEKNVTRFEYHSDGNAYVRVFTQGDQPQELTPLSITENYVEVRGKISDEVCIGQLYKAYEDLSRFYAGASTIMPIIATMTVYYTNTLAFDFSVGRREGTFHKTVHHASRQLLKDLITDSGIKTGDKTFTVLLDGRRAYCRISCTSAFPVNISALSFELRYSDNKGAR